MKPLDPRRVIRIEADAAGLYPQAGEYLVAYDPDGMAGFGAMRTDPDVRRAKVFATAAEAIQTWRQQSTVMPYRDDGEPNRPLTAFTISILPLDEA